MLRGRFSPPPLSKPGGPRGSLPLTDARTGFCASRRREQRKQGTGRQTASERAGRRAERFPFPGGQRPTHSQADPVFSAQAPWGAEHRGDCRERSEFPLVVFFPLVRGAALPARPSKAKGETIPSKRTEQHCRVLGHGKNYHFHDLIFAIDPLVILA